MTVPLSVVTLQAEFEALLNPVSGGFPATYQAAAETWAQALRAYFAEAAVPVFVSASLDLGVTAFVAAAAPKFAAQNGLAGLSDGAVAFALALVAVPPGVAVPPPAPPLLLPLSPPPAGEAPAATATRVAGLWAGAIDAWARLGAFGIPPVAPVPPWA